MQSKLEHFTYSKVLFTKLWLGFVSSFRFLSPCQHCFFASSSWWSFVPALECTLIQKKKGSNRFIRIEPRNYLPSFFFFLFFFFSSHVRTKSMAFALWLGRFSPISAWGAGFAVWVCDTFRVRFIYFYPRSVQRYGFLFLLYFPLFLSLSLSFCSHSPQGRSFVTNFI